MRQYLEFKTRYPDSIIFFQMGDFYEMFFDDAVEASKRLALTLTSRSRIEDRDVPLCGVPLHSGLAYARKLTDEGLKVAIVRQVGSEAAKGRGLAERYLWQVGTPGLPLDMEVEGQTRPNYLTAIFPGPSGYGLAGLENSTGDLMLTSFDDLEELRAEFQGLDSQECVLPDDAAPDLLDFLRTVKVFPALKSREELAPERALELLTELFGAAAVEAWDLERRPEALSAAAGVLLYARSCSGQLGHVAPPRLLWREPRLILDEAAQSNLEILKSLRHGETSGSLLGLMDRCATGPGSRLLRRWLTRPLKEAAAIRARHGAVEDLLRDGLNRDALRSLLKKCHDLERAASRLVLNRGGPRDLAGLRDTLGRLPDFARLLAVFNAVRLADLGEKLPDLGELVETLGNCLVDQPPVNAKDGGLIRRGVRDELDALMDLERGGRQAIADLEARERDRTGINSLKVGFNRVYGYYLEVTKANLRLVPEDWIRKQTIAGGERYLTPELKDWEEKISTAGERRLAMEEEIFEELRRLVAAELRGIKIAAEILAEVDVLISFADCAEKYQWGRPEIAEEDLIEIKGGRHPVVEALLPPGTPFVANDVLLNSRERLLIITGPNMAGKSTILRQVALIVLLNQAGSFVPADRARLSLRDRIFTRVGASDDLARGRSTFMVEMTETARILALATPDSLVVLDEVGRGTSTYDGLSLAWAIAEYLHDLAGRGVPTLFATHYHELIELARTKPLARNYNVAVEAGSGQNLIFTRQLKAGGVRRSFGLAVAAMAGLPRKVLDRAKEVLADCGRAGERTIRIRPAQRQLGLFERMEREWNELAAQGPEAGEPTPEPEERPPAPPPAPEIVRRLAALRPEEMTPLTALNLLNELVGEARNLGGAGGSPGAGGLSRP
jgi:DNA mismatch repair protein MutS